MQHLHIDVTFYFSVNNFRESPERLPNSLGYLRSTIDTHIGFFQFLCVFVLEFFDFGLMFIYMLSKVFL